MIAQLCGLPAAISTSLAKRAYCIVNEDAGYAYVNVAKAGCTSIKVAIAEHLGLSFEEVQWNRPHRLGIDQLHGRTDLLRFTFVRHPADRLVSCWADWCQPPYPSAGNCRKNPHYLGLRDCDFATFVREVVRWGDMDGHIRPQVLSLRIGREWIVDRVYCFESMAENWATLRTELGLPDLPHRRKSDHKPWREYYTGELVGLVDERFRGDFEAFGYEW